MFDLNRSRSTAAFGCPLFPKCKNAHANALVACVDVDLFGLLECWIDFKHRHFAQQKLSKNIIFIHHFRIVSWKSATQNLFTGGVPCHHGGQTTTNLSGNPTPYHQASRHSQITWITISTQKLVGGFNLKDVCASRQIGSRNPKT